MKTVELVFRYTQDEYVKAEREYLIAAKIVHKYDGIFVVILLLLSVLYLFLSSFSIGSIVFSGVVFLVTLLGFYIYFYLPINRFRKTAKYQEEYRMLFSEEAIRWKTSSVDSNLKWNIYSEVWENKDFYYLMQAPRVYALIPKRAFPDEEIMRDFEELALANLKELKHIG